MRPVGAREGLAVLFEQAPILALVEVHWLEEQHRLLRELLCDPWFVERVDDVVVEFGNAGLQELIDSYVAGQHVAESDLQRVWTETVGALGTRVFESPVYAEFFRAVRRSRRVRGADRPRVLLADPPYDALRQQPSTPRDEHFSLVVGRDVLARNRRALLLAGGGHLTRLSDVTGGNVVQRVERAQPGSCIVVFTHYVFDDVAVRRAADVSRLERRLSRWPVPSLARIQGTWLADIDPTLLLGDTARVVGPDGSVREVAAAPFLRDNGTPLRGVTLGDVADFYLYLGPLHGLTLRPPPRSAKPNDAART